MGNFFLMREIMVDERQVSLTKALMAHFESLGVSRTSLSKLLATAGAAPVSRHSLSLAAAMMTMTIHLAVVTREPTAIVVVRNRPLLLLRRKKRIGGRAYGNN
ncbi:MAG: hypothetical protein R2849_13580 [Thermomicrobiales bacterium]